MSTVSQHSISATNGKSKYFNFSKPYSGPESHTCRSENIIKILNSKYDLIQIYSL